VTDPKLQLGRSLVPSHDRVLRTPSTEVTFSAGGTPHLPEGFVSDLRQVMRAASGVGIAAPQVGLGIRVCVISWEDVELAWANPQIVDTSGEGTAVEGCLSLPGSWFDVTRPTDVHVRAYDLDAQTWADFHLAGWLARIACHECGHLDGTLIDMCGVPRLDG
jgi:peptide deformylase